MFVSLIKMMIVPVIFCTIVLGIGKVRAAATVGKVGGLAFVYFLAMSTVALAIGLVVGNLLSPGTGLNIESTSSKGAELAETAHEAGGLMDFVQHIIPTSLFSSLTEGNVLQALFVALLVGFALQAHGHCGRAASCAASRRVQKLVFKVLAMILWLAPIGAFGAIANVVGQTGWSAVTQLLTLMLGFYLTCIIFVFGVLGVLLRAVAGRVDLPAGPLPGPRVPADLRHLVVRVGAAPPDRQDGAPRRREDDRRRGRPDRLLVQPRRHGDLPDHGVAVRRRRHGQAAGARRADLAAGVHDRRLARARRASAAPGWPRWPADCRATAPTCSTASA